jgi:cell division protein FtsB
MLDIHQKRKLRSFLYNRYTLSGLAIIFVLLLHSTWTVYEKKRASEEMRRLAEEKVDSLVQRKGDLEQKIERLSTEIGLEEEIRAKFGVAKEGEKVVVYVPNSEELSEKSNTKKSIWQRIKNFFHF